MPDPQILVVDADAKVRTSLTAMLAGQGVQVSLARGGQEGLALLEEKPFDVLFTALRMPVMDGLTVLQKARLLRPQLCAILLAGTGGLSSCVEAIRLGACDYLTKPFTPAAVRKSLARALACERRCGGGATPGGQQRLTPLPAAASEETDALLVAESPAMRALHAFAAKIAPSDGPVLLHGEPGTRTDLVARLIHRQSRRAGGPLVYASCNGLYEAQLEAAFFGRQQQGGEDGPGYRGLLESAGGGTLFLNDIEALPLWAQVRLFDMFFRGQVDRVSGPQPGPPNVRLIASTSGDLEAAVAEGRFYAGLYYLLNVAAIGVPPLRDRRQDLPALVQYYLRKTLAAQGIDTQQTPWSFSDEAWECLLNYDWPGNLPELAGVVAHAVTMTDGPTIGRAAIACSLRKPAAGGAGAASVPLSGKLREIERHVIEETVQRCGGNKAAAARTLGLHRRTLYRMLEEGAGEPQVFAPAGGK